jgi:hypothetical protein
MAERGGVRSLRVPSGQQMRVAATLAGGVRGPGGRVVDDRKDVDQQGAAMLAPKKPGFGVPSGRPTQTPTVKRSLTPTAQASRKPKLVPVFQAMPRRAPTPLVDLPRRPGRRLRGCRG